MKRLLTLSLLFIMSCDETPDDEGFSLIGSWTITSLRYYTNSNCTGEYEESTGIVTFDDTSAYEQLVDEFSFQEFCEASGGTYDGSNCIMGDGSLFFDGDDYVNIGDLFSIDNGAVLSFNFKTSHDFYNTNSDIRGTLISNDTEVGNPDFKI